METSKRKKEEKGTNVVVKLEDAHLAYRAMVGALREHESDEKEDPFECQFIFLCFCFSFWEWERGGRAVEEGGEGSRYVVARPQARSSRTGNDKRRGKKLTGGFPPPHFLHFLTFPAPAPAGLVPPPPSRRWSSPSSLALSRALPVRRRAQVQPSTDPRPRLSDGVPGCVEQTR